MEICVFLDTHIVIIYNGTHKWIKTFKDVIIVRDKSEYKVIVDSYEIQNVTSVRIFYHEIDITDNIGVSYD